MATPDPVKMGDIKEEVDEKVNLPAPPGSPSFPENESLVSPCKEEISHDEIAAMRELAIAASEQVQKACYMPTRIFHPKTGRIRTPRENSDSESSLSDDDTGGDGDSDPAAQDPPAPEYLRKWDSLSTVSSHSSTGTLSDTTSPSSNTRWTRTSKGKYAINPIKCPPCARRKKADKCRGGPPCGECWSRGRKTAASCQEWGEGWGREG